LTGPETRTSDLRQRYPAWNRCVQAIALGATVVAIGRPLLWDLTCGGGLGVKDVYKHISSELRSAMLLSGVAKVTALNREYLALTEVD
jgi:isopentenyl diphosphate isomerase/L-lactate dehydrogenase-like FMN-dependent dehydrogenase